MSSSENNIFFTRCKIIFTLTNSIFFFILRKNILMIFSNLKDDNAENENEDDGGDYEPDDENIFDGQYDGDQDGPYSQNVDEHLADQLEQDDDYE